MDFTRKSRLVMDGHKTDKPVGSIHSEVVSIESARIAITYVVLNDLYVTGTDMINA